MTRVPGASVTRFPDLDAVLNELVQASAIILGDNFCGAYLQGSFAVGDADEHSDVDFVIVTHDAVNEPAVRQLRGLHADFPHREGNWPQHLDGSYFPKEILRRPDPSCTPLLYVDNGSDILEWSDHDNTTVVRWVLREYGVTLAGPPARMLVEPIAAEVLKAEVRVTIRDWFESILAKPAADMDNAWFQPYVVLTGCRMMHTLDCGRVTSKAAAGSWAIERLESKFAVLIQQALDQRPDPWLRVHQRSTPQAVEQTREFMSYVLNSSSSPQRSQRHVNP